MASYIKHLSANVSLYKKLFDYSFSNDMILYIPVQGSNSNVDVPVLSEYCRVLILRLIRMHIDFFECNLCFASLCYEDIFLDPIYDHVPKLPLTVKTVTRTPKTIDNNMAALVQVIKQGILSRYSRFPADLEYLFNLMSNNGHKTIDLVGVFSGLVPLENVRELVLRMNAELIDLKKSAKPKYLQVFQGVVFPADWEVQIQSNRYLIKMYNSRQKAVKPPTAVAQALPQLSGGPSRLQSQGRTVVKNVPNHPGPNQSAPAQQSRGRTVVKNVPYHPGSNQSASATSFVATFAHASVLPKGQVAQKTNQRMVNNMASHRPVNPSTLALCATGGSGSAPPRGTSSGSSAAASSNAPPTGGTQRVPLPWPMLIPGKYNAPGSDPSKEALTYNRNGRLHGPEEMQLTQRQVEIMMKSIFRKIVASTQEGLHAVGKLKNLNMDTLMPR